MRGRLLFLYDADCAACSRFKRLASFLDASHSVDFIPISEGARAGLLDSVPQSQWYASSRMIDESGNVVCGGDAMLALFGRLAGGKTRELIACLPHAIPAARWLYGVLSRLHGDSCSSAVTEDWQVSRHSMAWSPQ